MTQAELSRKLQTMTPNTPFNALLLSEFNVEVPEAAPKYQCEYLYKYCLSMQCDGVPADIIVSSAAEKVEAFITNFPWCKTKYDDVKNASAPKKPKSNKLFKDVADGSIVFNEALQKYEGFLNKKVVSRNNTSEKVQAWMKKKYNVESFLVG